MLQDNQRANILLGSKHKLSNLGKNILIIIEVHSGNYIGWDDIIFCEDIYGRNNP